MDEGRTYRLGMQARFELGVAVVVPLCQRIVRFEANGPACRQKHRIPSSRASLTDGCLSEVTEPEPERGFFSLTF
jgi:hypothetical protein